MAPMHDTRGGDNSLFNPVAHYWRIWRTLVGLVVLFPANPSLLDLRGHLVHRPLSPPQSHRHNQKI